jgi:SAM-dependent methyltransferase
MAGAAGIDDSWADGARYEAYVGRWSRPVAREFTDRLDVPAGADWVDVGSGTGILTEEALAHSAATVVAVDASADFTGYLAAHLTDPRASAVVADALSLPVRDASADVVVSGLMLNFVADRCAVLREMRRVSRPGGIVAAYVWDYPGRMELISSFWDAALELDPAAATLHEAVRFGFCRPQPLRSILTASGLADVVVEDIVVPTVFRDFDDYWTPFLSGHAPAPSYAMSLPGEHRAALRQALDARLPRADDGSIALVARAWAVRGRCG